MDVPSLSDHLSAIGANWVHSYDAAHMCLTVNKLAEQGIQTGVMWPLGCHAQPAYNSKDLLRNTDNVANTILSLPCWPLMTDDEIGYVIEKFNSII